MTFRALITLAEGIDDLQTVTLIDVLRRAKVEVVVASIEGRRMLTCARGTRLTADAMLVDLLAQPFDLIVLPGGAVGAQHLARPSTPATIDQGPGRGRAPVRRHRRSPGNGAASLWRPASAAHDVPALGQPSTVGLQFRRSTGGGRRQLHHRPRLGWRSGICPDAGGTTCVAKPRGWRWRGS